MARTIRAIEPVLRDRVTLARLLRPTAVVAAFIAGALATFAVLPHTLYVMPYMRSGALGTVPSADVQMGTGLVTERLDPPWVVMLIVGLVAASLAHWLVGRILHARDQ